MADKSLRWLSSAIMRAAQQAAMDEDLFNAAVEEVELPPKAYERPLRGAALKVTPEQAVMMLTSQWGKA